MEYEMMILVIAIHPSKTTFGQSTQCCKCGIYPQWPTPGPDELYF